MGTQTRELMFHQLYTTVQKFVISKSFFKKFILFQTYSGMQDIYNVTKDFDFKVMLIKERWKCVTEEIKSHILKYKIVVLNCNNISQYFCFYCNIVLTSLQ